MIVATFTNTDEQMETNVLQISAEKFKVLLTDLDSKRTLPYMNIYNNLEDAIKTAKHWANITTEPICSHPKSLRQHMANGDERCELCNTDL